MILRVASMRQDGLSTTEIGLVFSTSRSSVCGLIHRERDKGSTLFGPLDPAFIAAVRESKRKPPKPRARSVERMFRPRPVRVNAAPRRITAPIPVTPVSRQVPFLSVRSDECRWIAGDAIDDPTCCGAPVVGGRPYCSAHAALAYRQPERAQRVSTYREAA